MDDDHCGENSNWYVVRVRDLCIGPEGPSLLSELSLTMCSGRIIGITGPNGAGKTTLGYLIAQFAPHLIMHRLTGEVTYNDLCGDRASAEALWGALSYTFQNPDSQYTELRVRDELARVVPSREVLAKVISKYDLGGLAGRSFANMSYGERQRALWARDWSSDKEIYILDEVGSYLDRRWQDVVAQDLCELRDRGKMIILLGHPQGALAAAADEILELRDGHLSHHDDRDDLGKTKCEERCATTKSCGDVFLEAGPFETRKGQRVIRCPREITIRSGDVLVVTGNNGAGKTSLLLALGGLVKMSSKKVRCHVDGACRVVLQNPYSQSFEGSVEELLQGVDLDGLPEDLQWIRAVSQDRDPLSLSYGEQKAIHVLSALRSESSLVLIDELVTGLSEEFRCALLQELSRAASRGKGIVVTCHPETWLDIVVTDVLRL